MMHFVAFFEPAQNGDGILDRWLIHEHSLEPSLQGGVFLNVFAIFIQRGRTDEVHFASGQHRLEEVRRIHRPFGCTCTDHGVEFVDEEEHLPLRRLDFLEDGLQALFEFSTEFRPGDERAHIKHDDTLLFEPFGHIAFDDALRQAFDDGCFTDTRLTDQDGIVLGSSRQNLNGTSDFVITADDRIELALAREFSEISPIFL